MFTDPDPIEQDMNLRVEDMTPDQLVSYLKTYHLAFGITLAVDGYRERSVFRALQRVYGQADAGRIVKWAVYAHKGQYEGQPIRHTSFCAKRKFWTDRMHLEMQRHVATEKPKPVVASVSVVRF